MANEVVIVQAVRSAVGRAHKGALAQTRPDELAGQVVRALLAKVPSLSPAVPSPPVSPASPGCRNAQPTSTTSTSAWRARKDMSLRTCPKG